MQSSDARDPDWKQALTTAADAQMLPWTTQLRHAACGGDVRLLVIGKAAHVLSVFDGVTKSPRGEGEAWAEVPHNQR